CQFLGCTNLVFHPRTVTVINSNIAPRIPPNAGACVFPLSTAPIVLAVKPNAGSTAGGTPVTLTGTNFQNGATVAIGGVAAASVVGVNATTITATTGAHATGTASVTVTDPGPSAGTLSNSYFYAPPPAALSFFTVPPCRAIDTRNANGSQGGPVLAASVQRTFPVAGICGIPAGTKSVSANVTITGPTAAGVVNLYPGNAFPLGTSTINFAPGQTKANNAVVLLATDGSGTVLVQNAAAGTTQFILAVNGYFKERDAPVESG